MNGCAVRTNQLLDAETGRSVMLAFDHGGGGAPRGGEHLPAVLDLLTASAVQGVLLGPGVSRAAGPRFAHPGAPAMITALDAPVFSDVPGGHGVVRGHRRVLSARGALAYGATAAKVLVPIGPGSAYDFADTFELVAAACEEAHEVGLPVMVEPALWGENAVHDDTVIAHSARQAWELGADMIKIHAPRETRVLGEIVERSVGPVFVLGGDPAHIRGVHRARRRVDRRGRGGRGRRPQRLGARRARPHDRRAPGRRARP
ncbi:DhnA family fructose-bisphosphate aldolase class Ia [Microbacterium sp. SORGH_AS 888]|nr:DhnA family fructose-bisphosphate aldolase class Ia [Microbacterium sp. SORGH_AS_0888]